MCVTDDERVAMMAKIEVIDALTFLLQPEILGSRKRDDGVIFHDNGDEEAHAFFLYNVVKNVMKVSYY
jgi:hypothetical protein